MEAVVLQAEAVLLLLLLLQALLQATIWVGWEMRGFRVCPRLPPISHSHKHSSQGEGVMQACWGVPVGPTGWCGACLTM